MDCRQAGPYTYAARTCNKWALNRVMLIGDAAHVFPPCEYIDPISLLYSS